MISNSSDTMGQYNRSIPVGSIRSVVAINPAVVSANSNSLISRHLLSNNLSRLTTPTTSISTASYYQDETNKREGKDGGASSRVSLIAACSQISTRYDDKSEGNNSHSRITLATIINPPMNDNKDMEYRVLDMQYSANTTCKSSFSSPAYTTVCIATTMQHQSILLAIDSSGILHTYRIKKHHEKPKQVNSPLDMQECKFNTAARGSTPKKGKKSKPNKSITSNDNELQPLLSQMNTLSTRMEESIEQYTDNEDRTISSPTITTLQSPAKTKKGRKRKHSPSEAAHDIDERMHLVASTLNGQVLPSQSPPIAMVLSSSRLSDQWTGMAWSKITGLEDVHVPMTCIMYASKVKCGSMIWKSIISMMESKEQDTNEQECDEGIVLMGFQDGSLRAALVATNTTSVSNDDEQATSIDIGNTKTLLQLSCNEPIISLDMITTSSNSYPTLLCVGALGTMVTLSSYEEKEDEAKIPKIIVQCPLKLYGGRLTSIACVGCQSPDNTDETNVLYFISINDSNQTFLHRICLKGDNSNGKEDEQTCHRLPIPARIAVLSIHGFPGLSSDTTMFTLSIANGKSIVMKIPLSDVTNDSTTNTSMLSLLNGRSSVAATRTSSYKKNQTNGKASTLESLLRKLDLASTTNNKSKPQPLSNSIDQQTKHSMKEIREVTQVAASISSPSSKPLPMQCEVKHLESGRGVGIVAEDMSITKQTISSWITSVHIIQSCPQALSSMLRPQSTKSMPVLCYRRNKSGSPTRVVYGGTAASHNGNNNTIDVSMNNYIPISAYASLSMVYSDQLSVNRAQSVSSKTWQQSSNIAQSNDLLCSSGSAKRCSSEMYLGITLPFDIASRTNKVSPMTLDILDMRGSYHHTSVNQGDSQSNPRDIAEKQVLQWYQQSTSQQQYTLPMIREQKLIQRHSTGSSVEGAKVYCCSNLLKVGYSGAETTESYTANIGFGPMVVVKYKASTETNITTSQDGGGEVAFAVGSSLISPEQALSFLPLIRQAFMRQSKSSTKLLEAYHLLLTEKKTAKVAKHIIRSCDDLVTKVEKADHVCSNELLTAAISLYEIIRALKY